MFRHAPAGSYTVSPGREGIHLGQRHRLTHTHICWRMHQQVFLLLPSFYIHILEGSQKASSSMPRLTYATSIWAASRPEELLYKKPILFFSFYQFFPLTCREFVRYYCVTAPQFPTNGILSRGSQRAANRVTGVSAKRKKNSIFTIRTDRCALDPSERDTRGSCAREMTASATEPRKGKKKKNARHDANDPAR